MTGAIKKSEIFEREDLQRAAKTQAQEKIFLILFAFQEAEKVCKNNSNNNKEKSVKQLCKTQKRDQFDERKETKNNNTNLFVLIVANS